MKDTLRVLSTYPEIGISTSVGSGVIHWLGVLNPILSLFLILLSYLVCVADFIILAVY